MRSLEWNADGWPVPRNGPGTQPNGTPLPRAGVCGSMLRLARRDALRLGGTAVSVLLAGCGGEEATEAFKDSAGSATLEIVGANMEPRDMTAYVRVRRTHVPVCRYATPPCEQSAADERMLQEGYVLAADEVRTLADLSIDLRADHVAVVAVAVHAEPFEEWPARFPASHRVTGVEAGATHLADDIRAAFSLVPETTHTVRHTNRIHGWEFFAE